MTQGYQALTEKEKQTLRLIVRGHDAKSTARALGLSVHTINERLRDARRKLSVSSSREAARLVLDREGADPHFLTDKRLGEAGDAGGVADDAAAGGGRSPRRNVWVATGVLVMSLILATLVLSSLTPVGEPSAARMDAADPQVPVAAVADSEAVRATRQWLALVDANDWAESYAATASSFQERNTLAVWTSVSEKVRGDLGALVSRTLVSQESVPTPPAGVEVIKFRTDFANKPGAVETISLVREDGAWKVVGIYID